MNYEKLRNAHQAISELVVEIEERVEPLSDDEELIYDRLLGAESLLWQAYKLNKKRIEAAR